MMSNPLRRVMFAALMIGTLLVAQAAHAAPVPDFTLQLLDGKFIALKDYRGKPVLINFFHSK
jgi:cytochrome oxidase Cu insertion factor (SCO1/SenC/PrrC family)